MNPINYTDIFDFSDSSETEKFIRAIKAMESELDNLEKKAKQVASEAAKVLAANAAAAAQASQQLSTATQAEIAALAKKATALKTSTDAAKESKKVASEEARTLGELRKQLSQLTAAYDVNSNTVEEMNRKIHETTQQIKANQQAIRAAQADTVNATQIDIKALQTYNQKAQALNQLRARYRELNPAVASQREEMEKLLVKIQQLDGELKSTDANLGNFQRNVGNYRSALAGIAGAIPGASAFAPIISGAGGSAAAITALVASIGALISVSAKAQNAFIKSQGFQNAIKAVSDSSLEADTNMNFLISEADRLGLSIENLQNPFKSFIASAKGSSLQGEEARKVFTAVTSASAALGLSADETSRALTALGQMLSKGKVQSEELKGQLGEALPGAFNLAAKAMGVTTGELSKMLEKGEVLATDFLPKLANVLQQEYGDAAGETGLQGAINRMNNSFTLLFTNIGERLAPALESSYNKIASFTRELAYLFESDESAYRRRVANRIDTFKDSASRAKRSDDINFFYEQLEIEKKELEDLNKRRKAGAKIEENIFVEAKARVQALESILAEFRQRRANQEKEIADRLAKTEADLAQKRQKAAKEYAEEQARLNKKLYEAQLRINSEQQREVDTYKELRDAVADLIKEEKAREDLRRAKAALIRPEKPILDDEIAESPFTLINATTFDVERFDSFFDFQLAIIDNNRAIVNSFTQIGQQLERIFGDNPFIRFIQQAIAGYQAFLQVQETGIKLKVKDTAQTAANTVAQSKNAAAAGTAAVTKTAAQTGVGALAAVPAVVAVVTSALGIIKALFGGFEEGTEFLGKENPTAPLGKDSIPIIAAKGERILPYRLNKQLNGISNEELVKYARIGIMQGEGLRDVGRAGAAVIVQKNTVNAEDIGKAVAKNLSNLPVSVHVWDESGYYAYTQKMSKLRKINKRWFA